MAGFELKVEQVGCCILNIVLMERRKRKKKKKKDKKRRRKKKEEEAEEEEEVGLSTWGLLAMLRLSLLSLTKLQIS